MTERERLIDLLHDWCNKENDGINVESIADYLIENGVIVPPCKTVGDKIYTYRFDNEYKKCVVETTIIKLTDKGYLVQLADGRKLELDNDFIGKTVFLTREQAEKAIRKE